MENVTGAKAVGKNFFNRTQEIADFWQDIPTDNLLLLAPRRVGKTSLMEKVREQAPDHGFAAAFIDVSDCSDELSFVQRLYSSILGDRWGDRVWTQIQGSWLGKTVERIEKIGGGGFNLEFRGESASWTRLGEELAGALAKLEHQWIIQIDELPVFILRLLGGESAEERSRVSQLLYWMRRVRLQHTRVRWMLAGSIGLDTVAARLRIADAINDLRIIHLDAFDTQTAAALLDALAEEYKIDLAASVRNYVVTRIGWPIPYYLQLIFHELRSRPGPITNKDVDLSLETLLGPSHHLYFDYWRERLFQQLGQIDALYAVSLLHLCCRPPEGVSRSVLKLAMTRSISDPASREEKLRYLLNVMQSDGYLVQVKDFWRFRSPILREFWLRRLAPTEEPDGQS